jgi:hypothetical protein
VLYDSLTYFEREVQTWKTRIPLFKMLDDSKRVQVVVEVIPEALHLPIQFLFSGMRERRMPDIVCKRESFRQILVKPKRYRNGARDLRYLNGVSQAIAEMIVETGRENLGLVFQPSKCAGMDDPVTVALELVPVWMRKLRITPPLRTLDRKSKVHDGNLLRGDLAERGNGSPANRTTLGAKRLQELACFSGVFRSHDLGQRYGRLFF